jgi:hypothetical protein
MGAEQDGADRAPASGPTLGLLLFLLGAWICGTVFMGGVAAGNFGQVDPKSHPRLDQVFAALPEAERVPALRFVASEMNRRYFAVWSFVQVGLAAAVVTVVMRWRVRRRTGPWPLITATILMALALYLGLWVTPRMIEAGRAIDFLDRSQEHEEVASFYRQHGLFMVMDLVKLLLALGLTVWALLPRIKRASTADSARPAQERLVVKS